MLKRLLGSIAAMSLVLVANIEAPAAENPYLHALSADGTLRLDLVDHLKHPHFWWPRTLLSYRVLFDQHKTDPSRWQLVDLADNSVVPTQVCDVSSREGQPSNATLCFFDDLPSGAAHHLELRTGSQQPAVNGSTGVKIVEEAGSIVLDSGALRVRVPASQTIADATHAPGPIEALDEGKGWIGSSSITGQRAVKQITTEIFDRGPLFARVRITYRFDNGGSYVVTLRLPQGYNFVEMNESITGLTKTDAAGFDMTWTHFTPTQRRGHEPIDQPKIMYFRGEDPAFTGPARIEDLATDFYYRIAPVGGDSTISTTCSDFTDPANSRAIGIAVRDADKWDDGEYSIWASSDTLSIKFRYADHLLHWHFPLSTGSRDLMVAAYDPAKVSSESLSQWGQSKSKMAKANTGVEQSKSFIDFLDSRFGDMSLDVIKDWQLTYPDNARLPDASQPLPTSNGAKQMQKLDTYLRDLLGDSEAVKVEGHWLSPVSLRIMSAWVAPGFLKWRSQMSAEDRERVTALLLFHAYIASGENISAMKHVLRGHPNFMADWKYPLMAGAFLFPDHPMASEWADQFEKFLELCGVFYVRPSVPAWEAKGGRWTESIATYNWAFIQPATAANALGLRFDGRDRWPNPGLSLHGEYLAGIVSAPIKLGKAGEPLDVKPETDLTADNGFERVHPQQGAHSGRRQIPGGMALAGESLLRYAPLVGEHMLWAAQRPVGPMTNADGEPIDLAKSSINTGTNPRLTSAKFTGYGFVLRAAVDTPDEISVYLQQIDKGPNYRWGFGNEGGCGDIYYYAAGKSYTGHLMEDAGDRRVTDAELTSNTGVYKDQTFRGIGMNDLTEPLYNLDCAQFAEILPRQGSDAYSWPEYGSRSVMLVGHDYIITFDVVNDMSRMSWNTVQGQDEMPNIIPIRGETAYHIAETAGGGRSGDSDAIRLDPYKGGGDRMVLVSHKKDVALARGHRSRIEGVTDVVTAQSADSIFESRDSFDVNEPGRIFSGRAGVIRKLKDGRCELALFHGTAIGNDQLKLAVDNPNLGISAMFKTPTEASGVFFSRTGGHLTVSASGLEAAKLFIDGSLAPATSEAGGLTVALPPGEHRWQLTAGPVEPMPSQVSRTESLPDGAVIYFDPVAGATKYRLEKSSDGGRTWSAAGEADGPPFMLKGIAANTKMHVRVVALDQSIAALPGTDYPIYVTGQPPLPPSGIKLLLSPDQVALSWGQVLGPKAYILHRRAVGQTQWTEVYRGLDTRYTDHIPGIIPAYPDPGLRAAADRAPANAPPIYEYAVSVLDGVGEGPLSSIASTDPASWRNWQPSVPLIFKRQSAYWLPPYVRPDQVPPPSYPN
jgi:hypothetical protein